MASELYVETLKGLTSGANANKVIIPAGQTLDASAGGVTLPSEVAVNAYLASPFTLSAQSWAAVGGFNTEAIDTDNAFDGQTFTVPSGKGGRYLLIAQAEFWFNNAGRDPENIGLMWYVNDSASNAYNRFYYVPSGVSGSLVAGGVGANFTSILNLSAGDTVELYAYQDNGGQGSITLENGKQSQIWIQRLGEQA